jgi:hypothetical protein
MTQMNAQPKPNAPDAPTGKPERWPWWGYLVFYSQYILIALLVLCAIILRLVYGAP